MLTRDQLNRQYQRAFGRNVDESGFNTYSKFGDEEAVYQDLLRSDEYRNRQQPAPQQAAPQPEMPAFDPHQFDIQPLGQQDYANFQSQANAQFDPLRTASNNRFEAYRNLNKADFGDLETRLRDTAGKSIQGLEEGLNSRGLLRSGMNAAGQGDIQKNLSSDIGRADIARAMKDADLVLQEAGFNTDISKQASQRADEMAQQEYAKRQQTSQTGLENFKNQIDALKTQVTASGAPLDYELKKRGLDLDAVKTVGDIYTQFINADELIPPELYDKIVSVL